MKIGIFDSGIGGLFILKKLLETFPNNEYIYFGDSLNLPYGNKTKEELRTFSKKIINFLITKKVDKIIIACGTISSNIYEEIKNKYNMEIYDILSPSIEYLNNKNYENIAVLGTKKTIESGFFQRKLNSNVYTSECQEFVYMIESLDFKNLDYYLEKYLSVLKSKKIDALILGCTHFPYLKNEIREYLKCEYDEINLQDKLINKIKLSNNSVSSLKLYFSKVDITLKENVKKILENNYEIIEKVL